MNSPKSKFKAPDIVKLLFLTISNLIGRKVFKFHTVLMRRVFKMEAYNFKYLFFIFSHTTMSRSNSFDGNANDPALSSSPKKATALFDFDAEEDDELTLKAGDIGNTQFEKSYDFPVTQILCEINCDFFFSDNHRRQSS